ncbi:MBL fold metallo-hydrolase [Solemya velum gill symbiont]|uniref:MBL fold metallo-hydrolase n=1 Tax=Solemya velum gill symbiont TaxID=2340 RepID=UPI000998A967|nr:MBL fold metallo-hydrolase [Solemya velum gill symbiont]OOZ00397.1 MBL fold metallo-hydrolase [Solemya velum gill symbiont]OOZ02520.1 MBL fold metallo-hydrolase [Solemya velum gill symbiont]OOZ05019.1 MBL fold metallo-hydrolase [Solemya velum gill symbiont]OOZ07259.1 MBL fold metallo-hydrolase [Solemya velum gill symbiont]OOZ09441.1 MBL fold metallo-hydrolase [Solemya velum gill symbiont]
MSIEKNWEELGDDIYCIDTGFLRPKMAACYLIREGDAAAILDTGTNFTAPTVYALLNVLGLTRDNVKYVIPTHVHLDHAGGVGQLMADCANAQLVIHPKGAPHMIDPSRIVAGATAVYGEERFANDYGTLLPVDEERVIAAQDGDTFDLNGRTLTFYDTPGHANHHGCILDSKSRAIVTGDTFGLSYRELKTDKGDYIFAPSTPVAFDPDAWHQSIDKLMALNPSAMLLTHYSRVTDLESLAQQLHRNIDAISEIAISEEGEEAGRHERIKGELGDLTAQQIIDHGVDMSKEQILEFLSSDLELNAQGLEVWLKRRAKARG